MKTFLAQNVNKENLMSIGNLIKGLSVEDIKALSKDAFKYVSLPFFVIAVSNEGD